MSERGSGRSPGALLTRTRLELGLNQKAMAERVGVTQQTLSKLERGLYPPSLAIMERAAAAAGKQFAFLFIPQGWEHITVRPCPTLPEETSDELAQWERDFLEDTAAGRDPLQRYRDSGTYQDPQSLASRQPR